MSNVDLDQLTFINKDVNPYYAGLHARVDTELFHEPMLEMDQCDLNWSILSTHVDYTMHKDLDSPFRSMNTSNFYDRLGKDDYEMVLCIPTSKAHILMDMYHSSLIGGHTGITKSYQTICRRFYCPNLAEQL